MKDYSTELLKAKNAKIEWFYGRCFLIDRTTGKRLSGETHKDYDSAMFELRFLERD